MKKIDRRDFLKIFGGSAVATTGVFVACKDSQTQTSSQQEPPIGKMEMRENPNTHDKVSLLGYGMMRLPIVGGGNPRENPDAEYDQEMINRQVDYALAHGVNYYDTSPAYCKGQSEKLTGIALHRHPREKYVVATKMSNFADHSREASIAMFENSLKELQVDYIDYYLLHSIGGGDDAEETFNERFMDNGILDWLVQQKKLGRIRNLGFSYHGDISIFDMLLQWMDEGRYHWDFVQIELNYLDWDYANEINDRNTDASYLYAELRKRGIPAVIMEPLLGGRLANVPDNIVKKMKQRAPEQSVASWAFRYAGTPKGVLTVLSGMTYMEHLRENILTYSPLKPVSAEENHFLMEIAKDIYDLKTIPCNECNYCMPCPYGIDIPGVFTHYNKCIKEGHLIKDPTNNEYKQARRAFLIGYDRSVPKLRQADHCIGCGHCVSECPQRIDIPAQMRMVDEYAEKLRRNGKVKTMKDEKTV